MNWTERRNLEARRRRAGWMVTLTAVAAGAGVLWGIALPSEHVDVGQVRLPWSPETVWGVLTDLDGMPAWRSDLRSLERLPDLGGRPAWVEIGVRHSRAVEQAEAIAPIYLLVRTMQPNQPKGVERGFRLFAEAGGTKVILVERREIRNPLQRLWVRLPWTGGRVDLFLRDLEARMAGWRRPAAVLRAG